MSNHESRTSAHVQCELAVLDFMSHFDAGDGAAAASLFSVDGRWERTDGLVQGRSALESLIGRRKSSTVVRHVVTNLRTELLAPDHAVVRSYVILFKHQADGELPLFPLPLDGVAALGRYVDELRLFEGRWLIGHKSSVTEFKR